MSVSPRKLASALPEPHLDLHVCLGGLPVAGDRAALTRGCQAGAYTRPPFSST
jgi:hypothetical protein